MLHNIILENLTCIASEFYWVNPPENYRRINKWLFQDARGCKKYNTVALRLAPRSGT